MIPGQFIFNGNDFIQHFVRIQSRPIPVSGKRNILSTAPSNASGNLYYDLKTYGLATLELSIFMELDKSDWTIDDLKDALVTIAPAPLRLYYDPDYVYSAILSDEPTFSYGNYLHNVVEGTVKFELFPFKHSLTGQTALTKPASLTNPYRYEAYPYISLTGTGDVTLKIDSQVYSIVGLTTDQVITIDAESIETNLPTKLAGLSYPVLPANKTVVISTTGTVSTYSITPRYRRRL